MKINITVLVFVIDSIITIVNAEDKAVAQDLNKNASVEEKTIPEVSADEESYNVPVEIKYGAVTEPEVRTIDKDEIVVKRSPEEAKNAPEPKIYLDKSEVTAVERTGEVSTSEEKSAAGSKVSEKSSEKDEDKSGTFEDISIGESHESKTTQSAAEETRSAESTESAPKDMVKSSFAAEAYADIMEMSKSVPDFVEAQGRSAESSASSTSGVPVISTRRFASLNDFGSTRNFPSEIMGQHPPSVPNYNAPSNMNNRFSNPATYKIQPSSVQESKEFIDHFVGDNTGNSYPYVSFTSILPTTPPFDIKSPAVFPKLMQASHPPQQFAGNFYKPYDPNFKGNNLDPYGYARLRRYTIPEPSFQYFKTYQTY